MSDNLSTDQVANMFCNMTGADLNEAQRVALTRLLQGIYDSGVKEGTKDILENIEPSIDESTFEKACDGCKTRGPSLDMEEADLQLFIGPGKYCQFCRMSHIDKMLERIDPEESVWECDKRKD